MKIQLRIARGIRITINGQAPATNFSVGETEKGWDFHENIGTSKGVTVGPHEIQGAYMDVTLKDFNEGKDPTSITLMTPHEPITLTVTKVEADPEDETATLIDAEN